MLQALKKHGPRDSKCISEKLKLLDNSKTFYDGRKMIVNALKIKYFHFMLIKDCMKMKIKIKMNMVLLICFID